MFYYILMLFYNLTKIQIKTIVKYAIFIGLVYLILKSVPSRNIQNNELVLILGVVCISFLIIDMILSRGFDEEFKSLAELQPPPPPKIPVINREYQQLYNDLISKTDRADSLIDPNKPLPEVIKKYPSQVIRKYTPEEIKKYFEDKTQEEIKQYLDDTNKPLPEVSCSAEIIKVQRQMEQQMAQLKHELASRPIAQDDTSMTKRYYDSLLSQLKELNIINSDDVNNMNNKIATGVTTVAEAISSLEKLKNFNTSRIVKSDYKYNELPEEFFKPLGEGLDKLNPWDNQYSVLNTNKWRVPMPRPPICINTQPCKVCPDDTGLGSVDNSLKVDDWDSAKAISETKINKQWVSNQ